ncbi:hypothetical protein ACH4SK_43100 [Streptomyces inhibens]|uniref:hypothetical protein n=1 Tax=Streptomyces inhibens TaxID=2293571 RepID=UPI0037AB64BE
MARPTPGFDVVLLDPVSGAPADEGELAVGRADDVFKASGSGGIPFQMRLTA